MNAEWWQKVASMNRRELLDALVLETEAHLDSQDTLNEAQDREKRRESVVVGCTAAEIDLSMARLGRRTPANFVLTNSSYGGHSLRGLRLENDHVLMVPGWGRGKYADQTKELLRASGVQWENCRYAPSPETDRAEGLSNWGRTEAAIVDDTLQTLSNLMTRSLARTEEK